MPELLIVAFDDEEGADKAKQNLRRLPRTELLRIEDAVAVSEADKRALALAPTTADPAVALALPRALLASAFAGVFFLTAWGLTAAEMITDVLRRGRRPVDHNTAQAMQSQTDNAKSLLVLIVRDEASEEMIGRLNDAPGQIVRGPISAQHAAALRRHLRDHGGGDAEG